MTWTGTYESVGGTVRFDCKDTAKMLRKALKVAFPTTKFSVTSSRYAGGASIHVSYVDGPTASQVDAVAGAFSGAGFDGMIDLKYHKEHWLMPDGSVRLARREGTTGSVTEVVASPPSPNARLVSFGADYVLVSRDLSDEREAALAAEIEAFTREPFEPNKQYPVQAFAFNFGEPGGGLAVDTHGGDWGSSIRWKLGNRDYSVPCPHPLTVATVYNTSGSVRCGLCGEEV